MHKARVKDQFLYALLAAVFAAIAVMVVWTWTGNEKQNTLSTTPATEMVIEAQTANGLMQELSKTVDISVDADIQVLRQEASGL